MPYRSAVTSLSPSEGERVRVRGWAAVLNEDSVNVRKTVPPHPGPLPLRGGEGESLRTAKDLFAALWSRRFLSSFG